MVCQYLKVDAVNSVQLKMLNVVQVENAAHKSDHRKAGTLLKSLI